MTVRLSRTKGELSRVHEPLTAASPVMVNIADGGLYQCKQHNALFRITGQLRLACEQLPVQLRRLRRYGQRETTDLVRQSFARIVYWYAALIQIRNISINILKNK